MVIQQSHVNIVTCQANRGLQEQTLARLAMAGRFTQLAALLHGERTMLLSPLLVPMPCYYKPTILRIEQILSKVLGKG